MIKIITPSFSRGISFLIISLFFVQAQGATINWGTPQNISADTDIPSGMQGYEALNANGSSTTINGTTFSSSANISITGKSYSNFGAVTGLSDAYNNLLQPANWNVTSINLNELSSGNEYRVWVWSSDTRSAGASGRTTRLDATVTLDECVGDKIGNGGQFVSGTFLADGVAQTIVVDSQTGDDNAVINGVIVELISAITSATQSSDADASHSAEKAVDSDASTYSQTQDQTDSWWEYEFYTPKEIGYIELTAPPTAGARLGGLTVRLLDENRNTLATTTTTNPGDGGLWSYTLPSPVANVKYLRIGLENGALTDYGDHVVALAEMGAYSMFNLAIGKDSFMVRLKDSLPPASLGNDGDLGTYTETTDKTVDGYWEVDLGAMYYLTDIVVHVPAGFEDKMTHATVRFFDEEHDSVWSQHFPSTVASSYTFNPDGVRCARYVRVGYELKERSTGGGVGWHLGVAEVEVSGESATAVGVQTFSASSKSISSGQSTTLSWNTHALSDLTIYPNIGTVSGDSGSISVSPTASTCYTLVGTNECGVFSKSVSVLVNGEALPLRIEEFMVDNDLTIEDGHGNSPDWIEIFNPANAAVDLTGYGLSDNPEKPLKWVFPSTNIAAHARMIIFASGKDEIDPDGFIHTGFKLGDGESVVLTAPDGTTLDSITNFPAQKKDLAYGRLPDGSGWKFIEPTPEKVNQAISYEGWLRTPDFNYTRGFYTNAFTLAISNENAGATLYYSTDGSLPSTVYGGTISISDTKTVRAQVRHSGWKSSRIRTHTYLFADDVINNTAWKTPSYITDNPDRAKKGLMDLPILSISAPVVPDDYTEAPASMEIIYPDGAHSDLQEDCGIVRFGNSWQSFSKRQYRLKFKKIYGAPSLSSKILEGFDHGIPVKNKFDQIDLRSGSQDMASRGAYMSNRFVDDSMLDMDNLNPHGRFVHLFINGKYYGQFHFRERLIGDMLATYLPGGKKDFYTVKGNDNVGSSFVPGTPEPLNRHDWDEVRSHTGVYQNLKEYVDMSSLVDFMLLWFYGNCETEYRAATSVGPGSGEKFWMADADGFLRATGDKTSNPGPSGFFGSLVSEGDSDFMTLLADHIYKNFFNGGAMTPEANLARLNNRTDEIQDSFVLEAARWNYRSPTSWADYQQDIRDNLFPGRTQTLFGYLKNRGLYPSFDPPIFSQHGGVVPVGYQPELSTPVGTIYYMLDSSDPRLSGGGINPDALIFTSSDSSTETLISTGSSWKYLDNGSDQGTAWRSPVFVDTSWAAGNAQLGYGDGDETTEVSYGSDPDTKYTTTYFRKAFTLSNVGEIQSLNLRLMRDDGAVVYLNGTEVRRDNMPTGTIDYQTLASAAVGGGNESTYWEYALPIADLVEGDNVLAVEIHQSSLTSSDISFDLELKATRNSGGGSSPITLTNDTVITTRVLNNGKWSALSEAQFLMQGREAASAANCAITELHYNPDGSDDTEFIEIRNTSPSNIVDFTDVTLDNGVRFWFPDGFGLEPGAFAVVVEDIAAFTNRYSTPGSSYYFEGLKVAGQWTGGLSDDGETLTLLASNGTAIASFKYNGGLDWPSRANGKGSSIEIKAPDSIPADPVVRTAFYENPFSWRSSRLVHGSPGRFDSDPRRVVINEVLSHTDADIDWIELQNQGTNAVSIGNLWLGDHIDAPQRYQIPASTVLQPGEFMVINTNALHFGFSELGSEALLTEADGTNLVRFLDTVDFPAAEREIPFGRHTKSDATVDFTELEQVTKGATNAVPRIGSVVVSEILYASTNKTEFVELVNISVATVKLYDPNAATNTWQLSGAVDYSFPQNLEMAPGEIVVVCATNPAVFRAQYGLADSVRVYGPWIGGLDKAGENLKLRYPGDPEPLTGFVPYYRLDHVNYRPNDPWPTASTNEAVPLVRSDLAGYGNDPASWMASTSIPPSPGEIPSINRPPVLDPIGDIIYPTAVEFSYTLSATDPDLPAQPLTFSASGLPPEFVLNSQSGVIEGTGQSTGIYSVVVTVSDNQNPPLTDFEAFVLTLTAPFELEMNPSFDGHSNTMDLSFNTIPGEIYHVEASDSLTPIDWKFYSEIQAISDSEQVLINITSTNLPARYYRVRWMR